MSNKEPLYILDVYAFIYRAYFAFIHRPLRNSHGENVSALFGFFRFLFSLFEQRAPKLFVAALDSTGPTFRHKQFITYKATRQKTPDDLIAQIPKIEAILHALEIPAIRCEGYEADDIIATLARSCEAEERPCYIVSGDKDLLQLVGGPTRALRPSENFTFREIDSRGVMEEWGVSPSQIRDYLSLTGDASDNVPGVRGIGDKTARMLITNYGSLESIYEHLDEIQPESLRKKLETGKEDAFISKELITLCEDVPGCPRDPESFVPRLNMEAAAPLFLKDEMKSLVPAQFRNNVESSVPQNLNRQQNDGMKLERSAEHKALTMHPALATSSPPSPAQLIRDHASASYEAILDPPSLDEVISTAIAKGRCALDTETDSLDAYRAQLVGFSLCCEPGKAWYIPLCSPDAQCISREQAYAALNRLFKSGILLIGHNLKFDLHVLATAGILPIGPRAMPASLHDLESPSKSAANMGTEVESRLFDTMVAAWVLDPDAASFSLSACASRWLGISGIEYEAVVPKGKTFADVPLSNAVQYAAEDADFTLRLHEQLQPEIESNGFHRIFYDIEMPLLPILAEMERTGICVDPARLRQYGKELISSLSEIETEVFLLVGHPFNLGSPKQLAEVLFSERKLPVQKHTKTGYSTDTSVLEELAPLDPVPQLILKHRLLSKLRNTYVEPLAELAETHGRIHTTYVQTGAATGRLSSRDPNLQNIPIRDEEGRKIREAFIAEPGWMLISADYSQIELVVMAHLSQDPNLLKAFREGVDIHKRTASFIFGIPEADVDADKRRIAKTINFGVIYGMSAFRLARDLGIPNALAREFIDSYFSTYAGIAEFIKKTVEEAQKTGTVSTLFGRKRRILGIDSRNKTEQQAAQRVAVNTPIQGTAADIVKIAMIRVRKALAQQMPEVRMLLQVHDELIFEAPQSMTPAAMQLIKEEMEHAVTLAVPLRVSIESGLSWGDMHL